MLGAGGVLLGALSVTVGGVLVASLLGLAAWVALRLVGVDRVAPGVVERHGAMIIASVIGAAVGVLPSGSAWWPRHCSSAGCACSAGLCGRGPAGMTIGYGYRPRPRPCAQSRTFTVH